MKRCVQPEFLDDLPPDDLRAVRSRGDLRHLNLLMGNAGILAHALLDGHAGPPRRIVELGAGDGVFFLDLARKLSRTWTDFECVLVDRMGIVNEKTCAQFRALGCNCECVKADVFDWLAGGGARPGDWIVANLFLHHFTDEWLRTLLSLAAEKAECFAACETRRSRFALVLSRVVGLIGCNAVTRHDAVCSVKAGFRDGELSALWPGGSSWQLVEGSAGCFSHRFIARRRSASELHHHA